MSGKLIVGLMLLCSGAASFAEQLLLPWLTPESQSNVVVTAVPGHPRSCPPEYTNLISNTNLFTLAEQKLIGEIPLKYKNVTTNTGPVDTEFKGIEWRQWKFKGQIIKTFQVSCFVHTNSGAWEEIAFLQPRQTFIVYRTQTGDGYNVNLLDGVFLGPFTEYEHGVLNGLSIGQGFDKEHCNSWERHANGKLIGKLLGWNESGELFFEAEFKEPFDLSKNSIAPFDLIWEKAPTPQANSSTNSNPAR
jgi:hypothetical protein